MPSADGLKVGLVLLVALVCLSQTGCLVLVAGGAAAAGAGAYAYARGELEGTESAPLDRVWAATQAAVTELQLPITSRQKDALGARLLARTSSDKKVDIRLKKLTDTSTEIRIRIGTLGDESVSRLILDKIKKRSDPSAISCPHAGSPLHGAGVICKSWPCRRPGRLPVGDPAV